MTGARQCKATSKRSGEQCRRAAALGRAVCAMHGGKSLSGPAHPRWRDGRYWRVLPLGLRRAFERALGDPDSLSMAPEIAALDARADELLGRLSTGESGAAWRAVQRAWTDYQEARAPGDQELQTDALERLEDAIARGARDEETWAELARVWRDRRRFAESERKRLVELQVYTDVGRLAQVFSVLAEALVQHVPDRQQRRGVVTVMQKVLGRAAADDHEQEGA